MKKIGRLSTLYDKKHKYKEIKDIRGLGELEIITIHPSSIRSDILEDPQLRTLTHLQLEAIKRLIKRIKIPNVSETERTRVINEFNDYVVNYNKDDFSFVNTGKKGIRKSPRGQTRKAPLGFDNQVERLMRQTEDEVWMEKDLGPKGDMGRRDLEERLRKLQGLKPLYEKKFYEPSLEEVKANFEKVKKGSPRFSPRLQEQFSFDAEVAKLMEQTGNEVRLEKRDGKFDDWEQIDMQKRLDKLQGRAPRYKINSSDEPSLEELQDIFDNLGSGRRTKRKRKSKQKRKTKQKRRRKH
jgi:hypothetical protein